MLALLWIATAESIVCTMREIDRSPSIFLTRHYCNYFTDGGIRQMNSVLFADNVTVCGGDDNTRVSSGDNTLLTGYKPAANRASDATVKSTAADANSSLQEMKLPFLVYDWTDKKLQNRVSVEVLLPSGDSVDKKVKARVSQDGLKLVITLPMVPVLLSADKGLYV
jgi:hypothetical protein